MIAIISVFDKTDVDKLGHGLVELGAMIYSTGGTRRALEMANVPVCAVSELTNFPEILGGRVKTLHPAVHGGILARRHMPDDLAELAQHGLGQIDLVAVNLYPFAETVAEPNVPLATALENIDIGGPTMLRAAAKNFPAVIPLCDPADYAAVLAALHETGDLDAAFRQRLAVKAFRHTAFYDSLISTYLGTGEIDWQEEMTIGLQKMQELRYGENPQQRAAFYAAVQPGKSAQGLVAAQQLQGKPLSYNNILDADAAWAVVSDFAPLTVAIIKHTNPCGLARAANLLTAYENALAGDPIAAFGGIVAVNAPVTAALAERIVDHFYEIVLAPEYAAPVLEILAQKPNLRVLELPLVKENGVRWRSVIGGMLAQEVDSVDDAELNKARVVTKRVPTDEEWAALSFAWRAARHVKSNAIVLAQGQALVGMGAGQPSRIAAAEVAIKIAGERAAGAALASDAFFPKADGIEVAARAGVRAIVQPGGSLGDAEVIAAADAANMAMVFTGKRHFLH